VRATALAWCVLAALLAGCGPWGPQGIFPGGPLIGEVVADPIEDWSFTDEHLIVSIETRRGWLRHSVTVLCAAHAGHLYVPSRHAPHKRWVQNVLRDSRVRVGVAGRIYEARAERVTQPDPEGAVARKFVRKYIGVEAEKVHSLPPTPDPGEGRAEVWTFRLSSEGAAP
jgi:hypothetical protein